MRSKKIIWSSVIAGLLASSIVWSGWFAWTGPYGPTHVTVLPYIQPGTNAVALNGIDSSRLVWVARGRLANFSVDYGTTPAYGQTASVLTVKLAAARDANKHVATLTNLVLDSKCYYRVRLGDKVVREDSFAVRKTATNSIHFVAVGDTVHNKVNERRIAWQMHQQHPDFLVHLGDIVYFEGTVGEYTRRLWPCYNDPSNFGPDKGAPIMGSVPFYVVLGNHDVRYGLDLAENPTGLAAFYYFHAPLNGPRGLKCAIPVTGKPQQLAEFREAAGDAFPNLSFYSFENGPAHFLFLDGNNYTDFSEPALRDWIERDLARARTPWKFVITHQPGFQTAVKEYKFQQLRLLSPMFERLGVDVVFSGHTHNYQRTYPLRFAPHGTNDPANPSWVNGRFTVDERFDGMTNQRPDGIIHVVSGAGGMRLHDAHLHGRPVLENINPANWVPITAKLVADRYSFSDVTVTPDHFTLRQIDDTGQEIDCFEIRKQRTSVP